MIDNHEANAQWTVWGCWTGREKKCFSLLSLNKTSVICVVMISCRGITVVSHVSGRLQCVCVCETPLCSVTTNPRSHTSPFLWLTWGRFWSSSWTVATRYPAPPCAVTDSHLGIRPAGWRRWLLPLAHPEWRCFLSSSGCWLTDLNPFSHLSSEEHGRRHRSVHTSRLTPVHTHYQGTHTWHAFINVVVSWEISQYCTHIENNVTVPREKVTKGFGWNRHHLHFLKKKTTKTC